MESKLKERDDEHGETGWLNHHTTIKFLFNRLQEEIEELSYAIDDCVLEEIKGECIDIANFAMMIRSRAFEVNRKGEA